MRSEWPAPSFVADGASEEEIEEARERYHGTPQVFTIPVSDNFRSHMRKAARVWWADWCETNLKWGDKITITESHAIPFGTPPTWSGLTDPWSEDFTYQHVDDSHVNCISENGVHVGIPTCYVIKIEKKESWNDEWL